MMDLKSERLQCKTAVEGYGGIAPTKRRQKPARRFIAHKNTALSAEEAIKEMKHYKNRQTSRSDRNH